MSSSEACGRARLAVLVDRADIALLVRDAYLLVAPARLRAAIDAGPEEPS